ncbi:MAG: hypothetical protein FWE67_11970 [Planctomycetaceae bacterium]|nr:hypothetical protein [Planctomycetaceae bacterium]
MFYHSRTIAVFTVLLAVLSVQLFSGQLFSQDFGGRSRDGGRGPGMGPGGGQQPWMRGGTDGGRVGMRPPGGQPGGQPPWGSGQPPWMNRGGTPQQGGGQNEADRNERVLGMLRAMDTNGNGILEPNEVPEYRRQFVNAMVSRLGGDPNRPINLNDLARRASAASGSNSAASTPRPAGSTSTSNRNTADPLVPYFGEKEPAKPPVLEFGQREPVQRVAAISSPPVVLSQSDQILRSARDIMNKHDKNKNGTLDKDKGEWVGLPFNADRADKNRDGRISMAELISALGGQSGASVGAAAVVTKSSTPYDRLPPGMPDWFIERDKNRDGQLTMVEWANGQPWTEAMADEFLFLDKNNDGLVTVAEVFETLKQVDEEKRLKEEQAQRERERLQGVGNTAVAATAQPAGTPAPTQPAPEGQAATSPPSSPQGTPVVQSGQPQPVAPSSTSPSQTAPAGPGWRPGAAVPTSAPSTAPYSGGSSPNNRPNQYSPGGSRNDANRNSRYGRAR